MNFERFKDYLFYEQISIPIDLSQSPVVEVVIAKNAPIRKPLYFVPIDNNFKKYMQ